MHTLYDSESYSVTHMLANADVQADGTLAVDSQKPVLMRHGFEIVDKQTGKEIYLDGSWAELFQQRITAWQQTMPTQEEVEDTLSQFAVLAHTPRSVH